jgi:hypothetical protein
MGEDFLEIDQSETRIACGGNVCYPIEMTTGFVTRLTRWVLLVEQELVTLPEHLSSPPDF